MNRSVIAIVLFAVACKSAAPVVPPAAVVSAERAPAPTAVPAAVIDQLAANFERVHFAYDSATLDGSSLDALARNATLLQAHPSLTVEVQGHCDERGTVDYNVLLGDRRATTVRDALVRMGVGSARLATLSYGEERPVDPDRTEVAWSQNRRAEFRILRGSGVNGTTQ